MGQAGRQAEEPKGLRLDLGRRRRRSGEAEDRGNEDRGKRRPTGEVMKPEGGGSDVRDRLMRPIAW